MKILITTDMYAPSVNGVVTSTLNLVKKLEEQGHEVRVLTLAQNRGEHWRQMEYREDNVWYLPSVGVGKIYPGARIVYGRGRAFLQEMIAWKPDIVHSQCEFTTFWFAAKIAREAGAKFVHTYHTVYEDYTHYFSPNRVVGKKAASLFSRSILKQVDEVIVPTEKIRRLLLSYGVEKPIWTVPSGIDCGAFAQAAFQKRREKEEKARRRAVLEMERDSKSFGLKAEGTRLSEEIRKRDTCLSGKKRRLITVGRVAREKNLEELFRRLAEKRGEGYELLVVGDGPCRKELEKLAQKLEIENRVVFAGMVPPHQVAEWYQKGDIFVSASRSETQGLTYLEALAGGLPAVCKADECLEGVIRDGKNGWQYHSPREFFQALEALEDDQSYEQMSRQAMVSAARFDWAWFGEEILKVYESGKQEKAAGKVKKVLWKRRKGRELICG